MSDRWILRRLRITNFARARWRKLVGPREFTLMSAFYFAALLLLSIALVRSTDQAARLDLFVSVLLGIGGTAGGIVAIVFAFSTLILQNAAASTSMGFYRILAEDRRTKVIFVGIASIATLHLLAAIWLSTHSESPDRNLIDAVTVMCVMGVGSVFWLLYYTYRFVHRQVNPRTAMKIIVNEATRFIARWDREVSIVAGAISHNSQEPATQSIEHNRALGFLQTKSFLEYLKARLDFMLDYHDRLVMTRERTTALMVLSSIRSILDAYLSMRRDCSMVTDYYMMEPLSDSNDFLRDIEERLIRVGVSYIKEGDDSGSSAIISFFERLAVTASGVKYLNHGQTENPVFVQCVGNLRAFISKAGEFRDRESLFQGATALGRLGVLSINNGWAPAFIGITQSVNEIVIMGVALSQDVVQTNAVYTFGPMLNAALGLEADNARIYADEIFTSTGALAITAAKMPNGNKLEGAIRQFFEASALLISHSILTASGVMDPSVRRNKLSPLVTVSEVAGSAIRQSVAEIRSADRSVALGMATAVGTIGDALARLTSLENCGGLREVVVPEIRTYMHLPSWFLHADDSILSESTLLELSEVPALIGMRLALSGEREYAHEAAAAILRLADRALEQPQSPSDGLYAARVAVKTCFIGIVARSVNATDLAKAVASEVIEWRRRYFDKLLARATPDSEGRVTATDYLDLQLKDLMGGRRLHPSGLFMAQSRNLLYEHANREHIAEFIRSLSIDGDQTAPPQGP